MTEIITLIDVVNRIKKLSTELENKSINYSESRSISNQIDRLSELGKYLLENPHLIYIPTKESLELLGKTE